MIPDTYFLQNNEIPDLLKLWNEIKYFEFSNQEFLEKAVNKFNLIYDRSSLEDKLLDIIIAFEILFSDSGSKNKSDKCAKGATGLIRNNAEDGRKIFEIMKEAYRLRNKLVHSGKKLENPISIPEPINQEFSSNDFIKILHEYLAQTIKKFIFLLKKYTRKQIIDNIEHQIFEVV